MKCYCYDIIGKSRTGDNCIKIGFTKNTKKRLSVYRVSDSSIDFIDVIQVNDKIDERAIQYFYEDYRLFGEKEKFRYCKEVLESFPNLKLKEVYSDNFNKLDLIIDTCESSIIKELVKRIILSRFGSIKEYHKSCPIDDIVELLLYEG